MAVGIFSTPKRVLAPHFFRQKSHSSFIFHRKSICPSFFVKKGLAPSLSLVKNYFPPLLLQKVLVPSHSFEKALPHNIFSMEKPFPNLFFFRKFASSLITNIQFSLRPHPRHGTTFSIWNDSSTCNRWFPCPVKHKYCPVLTWSCRMIMYGNSQLNDPVQTSHKIKRDFHDFR